MLQSITSDRDLANGTWLVDPTTGYIAFTVKAMWGLAKVKGTFDRYEGALHISDDTATGELTVHTDSLNTKHEKRDTHLRSADFFDASSHPVVSFTVDGIRTDAGQTTLSGELRVGTSRTNLKLPVDLEPAGEEAMTIRAKTAIPREDVGLNWNKAGMIKGDAQLDIELRLLAPGKTD